MNKDRLQMYISVTRIAIVLCWLSLFYFWSLKIFGGNFFEIMVENENFLKFSQAVQNTWLKYLVSFFTIFLIRYLMFCAICQKFTFKGKELVIISALIISVWAVVNFGKCQIFQANYVYVIMIVLGIVYQKYWKRLFGVLAIILELSFSGISIITRNIELQVITDYLVLLILYIDVYFMTALYYLYSNLKTIERKQ